MNSNRVIMVNPNLGHPRILNYKENTNKSNFKTNLLFITEIKNPIKFKNVIINCLSLIPIYEYKWKLTQYIKKRGFSERLKNLWKSLKRILSWKRKEKEFEFTLQEWDKFGIQSQTKVKIEKRDIKKLRPHVFRGSPIIAKIIDISSVKSTKINNPDFIEDQFCRPQPYLNRLKVFGNLKFYYTVTIEFTLNNEMLNFLSEKRFLMFDLLFKNTDFGKSINYHALVISKNNWINLSIVQATDLHIAKRNDQMYLIIYSMYQKLRKSNIKTINQIEKTGTKLKEKLSIKNSLNKIDLTYRKRLINPNNLFRKFITIINEKVLNKEIDFVVFTGDLVDFSVRSKISKEYDNEFEYERSNWKIFKNILLNINQSEKKGVRDTEEILCPIFTITGNHDYRPWQYDLNWGGIYKKVGLKKEEAKALKEEYSASPIKSILKSDNSLKGYLLEINPSLDYYFKLGNLIFIFLNTGSDSYKKISDFISGSPSLTGFSQRQIKFLKNIIKYRSDGNSKAILWMHAPPVNTRFKRGVFSRIKKLFKKVIKIQIEQFRESKIGDYKRKKEKSRIDNKFNIRFGTITSNWKKLMNFCQDNCVITISGHTHLLNEYRLERIHKGDLRKREESEESIAVFYDDYSELYQNKQLIEKHHPFIVQTPALGFKSHKKPGKVGAYREIKIEKGKLASFKIKYL